MLLTLAIATWNRSALLRQTLESVAAARPAKGVTLEILVCDNNSTDDTRAAVEWLRDRLPVTYLFEPTQGKSLALNRLLEQARGEWVVFIDDDVIVDAGWLEAYIRAMREHPDAACLGGPVRPRVDGPISAEGRFLLDHYPQVCGWRVIKEDHPMTADDPAWGANMAVRRGEIAAGFDTTRGMFGQRREAGEDTDLLKTILKRGLPGYMVAGAAVEHHLPPTALSMRRFHQVQVDVGRSMARCRPVVPAGRWGGFPFWAWRRLLGLRFAAALRWRPWPTLAYHQAVARAGQYHGYLIAARTEDPNP